MKPVPQNQPQATERRETAPDPARLRAFAADINQALNRGRSLPAMLQECATAMHARLDGALARIWVVDEPGSTLELQASAGLCTHLNGPHSRTPVGTSKIGLIAERKTPHLTNDAANDPLIHDKAWARSAGITAFAGFPLLVEDRCIGVLALFAGQPLPGATLDALAAAAPPIAQAIERVRAQERLRRAREAAESASRTKGEFLSNMSHEIRTPMNGIIGLTELMLETPINETQRHYLETVKRSAEGLMGLLNDILDFSEIEDGLLELETAEFSLRRQLGATMKTLAVRAEEKGLALSLRVAPRLPDSWRGDVRRLQQVIVHLVGNAIKFTENGEVSVEVDLEGNAAATDKSGEAAPGASAVNPPAPDRRSFLYFVIRDTGIGIPRDRVSHIFKEFAQLDGSSTRRYGGTGLGLSIARRLIERMGGTIWVESDEGQGSAFHFIVKLEPGREAAAAPEAPDELAGLRVLVAAGQKTPRAILEELLRSWRMEPIAVSGADAALAELRSAAESGWPFKMLIVDDLLPDVDGRGLVERIREQPGGTAIAILMLCSVSRSDDPARTSAAAPVAWVAKPVQPSELLDAILGALNPRAARPAPDRSKGPGPAAAPRAGRLNILLAEDNPVNRELAVAILIQPGHRVVEAWTGRQAIDLAARQRFDLIVMDVQMPELDGLEATRLIREREGESGRRVPIIALTAHAMKGDRELCLAAGVDAYLSKPVRRDELLETVARLTGKLSPASARPVGSALAPTPHLDLGRLQEQIGAGEEMVEKLVEMFLAVVPEQLASLRRALSERDHRALAGRAHLLKGSIGNFGTGPAYAAASRLEQSARRGEWAQITSEQSEFESQLEHLIAEMEGYRESRRSQTSGKGRSRA